MKIAIATLSGVSPYSQSRAHETPSLPSERPDAKEERTWREKCHSAKDGHVFIPPMSFKLALDTAASMIGRKIPGRGNTTYTKFFMSGVLCTEPVVLPDKKDTVRGERVYCNADGKRGSGKRVWKIFPVIDEWRADVSFNVLADEITQDIFEEFLKKAGAFVGIGRFRPQQGGFNGRFKVEKVRWQDI